MSCSVTCVLPRRESFGRARGCPSPSAHLRKDNWSSSIYLETRRDLADRSHVLRKMGQERSLNPRWHHRPGTPGLRPDSFVVGEEEMTMLKTLYLFFSCNMRLNLILSQAKDQTKANDEMDRRGVPQRQVRRQGPKGLEADGSSDLPSVQGTPEHSRPCYHLVRYTHTSDLFLFCF